MKAIGLFFCGLAVFVFWGLFFKVAPIIANAIPPSDWKPLLNILAYGIVGYFGGIAIPIALLIVGIGMMVAE